MQGFVHELFCQKWARFGAAIHYCKLFAHLSYLVLLAVLTFGLKEHPEHVRQYVVLPSLVLLLLLCLVYFELRALQLWWTNQGGASCNLNRKEKLRRGFQYFCYISSHMLLAAYACAAAAMVLLLSDNGSLRGLTSLLGSKGAGIASPQSPQPHSDADAHGTPRALRQGGGGDDSSRGWSEELYAFDEAMFDEAVAGQANHYGHEGVH